MAKYALKIQVTSFILETALQIYPHTCTRYYKNNVLNASLLSEQVHLSAIRTQARVIFWLAVLLQS